MVYIGFATLLNDVTFHLLKYIASDEEIQDNENEIKETDTTENQEYDENLTDKGHFKSILKLERIDSSINPIKVKDFLNY